MPVIDSILYKSYPLWNELNKEQQAERNKKLEEYWLVGFIFLDLLKAKEKMK